MKNIFLILMIILASVSTARAQTALSAKDQATVLRDIRYMIYDEIHILAQNYMNPDPADKASMMLLGQQKIADLLTNVKSFYGGNDAPNSMYQQAVATAKQFEADQLQRFFTSPDQKAAVEQIFQNYSAKGVLGQ